MFNSNSRFLVLYSYSVVSDSASRGLQHGGLPCPLLFPGICSNSCLGTGVMLILLSVTLNLILCTLLLIVPSVYVLSISLR